MYYRVDNWSPLILFKWFFQNFGNVTVRLWKNHFKFKETFLGHKIRSYIYIWFGYRSVSFMSCLRIYC